MSGSLLNPLGYSPNPLRTGASGQGPEAFSPEAQARIAPTPMEGMASGQITGLSPFDGQSMQQMHMPQYGVPSPTQPMLPPGFNYQQAAPATFAQGGVIQLEEGGKVAMGPGGGLDDLIPTTIDGHRAAALSDGEFVIPADVVSMMGDGSSNAGARRLYDMVKHIRSAKTGTDEQAEPLQFSDILRRIS